MSKETFGHFLQQESLERYTQVPVVQFLVEDEYPLLFFAHIIRKIRATFNIQVATIDLCQTARFQVAAQLKTAFLGQSVLYWLKGSADLPKREQEYWHEYLRTYTGPHCLWICTPKKNISILHGVQVKIPSVVAYSEVVSMWSLFEGEESKNQVPPQLEVLRLQSQQLSVDNAYLLLNYIPLLGKEPAVSVQKMLKRIIPSESSLFSLSSALLAKKPQQFYTQWKEVQHIYSSLFWCSYFSEIIWRAAQYVRFLHAGDTVSARAIAYRLPFSFTRSDWRFYSYAELQASHELLYVIDHEQKNGRSDGGMDRFFSVLFQR